MNSLRCVMLDDLPDGKGLKLAATSDDAHVLAVDKRFFDKLEQRRKRKLCVSVCSGCSVGCVYCFTNGLKKFRPLSAEEIVEQVAWLEKLSPANGEEFDEVKITFKEMGDPLLNPDNVLEAIRRLTSINPKFHFIVSTSAPFINQQFYDQLAEQAAHSQIRLTFSCHTTSNMERQELHPKMPMLILEEIAEIVKRWPGERVTLNFIIIDGYTYDADKLARLFDPARVFIKLNFFDDNKFVRAAGLKTGTPEQKEKFAAELKALGFSLAERHRTF